MSEDTARREKTEVPEQAEFQTKPEIALDRVHAWLLSEHRGDSVWQDAADIPAADSGAIRNGTERNYGGPLPKRYTSDDADYYGRR